MSLCNHWKLQWEEEEQGAGRKFDVCACVSKKKERKAGCFTAYILCFEGCVFSVIETKNEDFPNLLRFASASEVKTSLNVSSCIDHCTVCIGASECCKKINYNFPGFCLFHSKAVTPGYKLTQIKYWRHPLHPAGVWKWLNDQQSL